jgi:S-adenosyl-L-homocysteine hydrolase, NAD binding domain
LLFALHKYFPNHTRLCTGFEQTGRGIAVLDKMIADGTPVQCPVVNMAHSALKADTEIPLIGENIVFDALRLLDDMNLPHPDTATVLGYGAVGQRTADALRRRGIEVAVFDPNPTQAAKALADGCTVMNREEALGFGEMVIGCTGRGSMDIVDDHHLLQHGAVVVNGASGNHEVGAQRFGEAGSFFLETAFEPQHFNIRNGAMSAHFMGIPVSLGSGDLGASSVHRVLRSRDTHKEVMLLRSGHVVNLGRDLPPEFIQVTRALVMASLLHSQTLQEPGVVALPEATQQLIKTAMDRDLAGRGLRFDAPDFTSLPSWDL